MLPFAHQLFRHAERMRRVDGDPFCQVHGGVHQLAVVDNARHKPPVERGLGIDHFPGKGHFRGAAAADDPRQEPGPAIARNNPEADEAFSEAGGAGGNADIAHAGQVEPGADRRTVHGRDGWYV